MGRSISYGEYLRLPALLGAQNPVSPPTDTVTHSAEHFFITVHQGSELWLKQVLVDLSAAASLMTWSEEGLSRSCDHLLRAAAVIELIVAHTKVLLRMAPGDFARFRPSLGDASGAQSAQFRRLFRQLGLPKGESPLFGAYVGMLSRNNVTLEGLYARGENATLLRLAEAFAALAEATWSWQAEHVRIATHMLGNASGTGGSTGVDYLLRRVVMPFPQLWAAKAAPLASQSPAAGTVIDTSRTTA